MKHLEVQGIAVLAGTLALAISVNSAAQTAGGENLAPPAKRVRKQEEQQGQAKLLGTILVRGRRLGSATGNRAQALKLKKEAPNIVEVQPLSEIRKLPDVNVAEALQRLPGISLETDSGEGRFINIRGLDAALNGTTYGNVRLPASNPSSAFGQGRAVALDTVPPGMVGGLILTETNRPDQDAEALGGTVELVPRTGEAHGGKFFAEATLGGGYKPLHNSPIYNGSVTLGGSFGLGDGIGGWFRGPNAFSALLTASYYDEQLPVDDLEEDYSDQQSAGVPDKLFADADLRHYNYQRRRYGIGATLTARGNANNSFYLRFLVSGYTENKHTWHLGLDGLDSGCDTDVSPADCSAAVDPSNPNGFIAPDAQASHELEDNRERIQTTLGELGGNSLLGGATLDYHVAYAKGEDRSPWAYDSSWVDPNAVNLAYNNIRDPRYPAFHPVDGTNLADPANYTLDTIAKSNSFDSDRILSKYPPAEPGALWGEPLKGAVRACAA
jgi:TonB-dependent receptor